MSDNMQGQAAQEPQDPRPVLWCVGSAFDRRADMLWQNKPCRDVEQVLDVIRDALARKATEIKIRDFAFAFSEKAADAAGGEQGFSLHGEKEPDQPAPEDAPAMRDAVFVEEPNGARVANIYESSDQIVEVQDMRDGTFHLIIHRLIDGKDYFDDKTAVLKREHFAMLGSVGSAPPANPTGSMNTSSSNPLPQDAGRELVEAARDVLAERRRQIEVEGWTAEHDDKHAAGEMADAAACYAASEPPYKAPPLGSPRSRFEHSFTKLWPWEMKWWKPGNPLKPADRRKRLVKAGALILAEIERFDRHRPAPNKGEG